MMTPMQHSSSATTTAGAKESRHFQSLQLFTSHAEPGLDEFLSRREQIEMENKHRDEEDKLYRSGFVYQVCNE